MVGADIAAILYALAILGQSAARGVEQMKSEGLTDEELQRAWRDMQRRLDHANELWLRATAPGAQAGGDGPAAAPGDEEASRGPA